MRDGRNKILTKLQKIFEGLKILTEFAIRKQPSSEPTSSELCRKNSASARSKLNEERFQDEFCCRRNFLENFNLRNCFGSQMFYKLWSIRSEDLKSLRWKGKGSSWKRVEVSFEISFLSQKQMTNAIYINVRTRMSPSIITLPCLQFRVVATSHCSHHTITFSLLSRYFFSKKIFRRGIKLFLRTLI